MKKKCKVLALPTEKEVGLGGIYRKIKNFGVADAENVGDFAINKNWNINHSNVYWKAHHLYIVSEDEIKVGDYVIVSPFDDLRIKYLHKVIVSEDNQLYCQGDVKFSKQYYVWNKVIATTDEQLGLPIIPERFMKEYCDEGGVDEVMCEVSDEAFEIYPVKESWTREEVEQLCRKAFSSGYITSKKRIKYKYKEDEFINNNL